MTCPSDKQMAKLILDLRAENGYTMRWFARHKSKRLVVYFIIFAAVVSVPLMFAWWVAVGALACFGAGVMFCYVLVLVS